MSFRAPQIAFFASLILGSTAAGASAAGSEPVSNGFGLAWVVAGLMALSLLYALISAVLTAVGRPAPILPERATILIPILSVIGLGVALYLTYVETQNVAAVCGPVGDCNAVQASPYAKLGGVLPVGLMGAIGYVAILAAWALARFTEGSLARLAPLAIFAMALFGVLFSLYLTYLELFIILAVCIWCLTSAVIMAFVLVLSVGPAVEGLSGEDEG